MGGGQPAQLLSGDSQSMLCTSHGQQLWADARRTDYCIFLCCCGMQWRPETSRTESNKQVAQQFLRENVIMEGVVTDGKQRGDAHLGTRPEPAAG